MNAKYFLSAAMALSLLGSPSALAKSKPSKPEKIIGVRCTQAADSFVVGISQFKPSQRKSMRKGMKFRVNLSGEYGPVWCVVI
jgi:hypothetical protein